MRDRLTLPRRTLLATAAGAALAGPAARAEGRGIALIVDPADPVANAEPVQWATGLLHDTLAARGNTIRTVPTPAAAQPGELRLVIVGATHRTANDVLRAAAATLPTGPEALAVAATGLDGNDFVIASGTDARGLVYAVTELLDRIATEAKPGEGLRIAAPLVEHPANKVRSISRLFSSEVEDKAWLHDREFWREYLTMLVTHRFNRFSLALGMQYNYPMEVSDVFLYLAYPFLFAVPGYDVRAQGLSDEERDRNYASLKFIAAEAARRGLEFQLGLWTHAYKYDSPRVNYLVTGVNPQTHAAYCADAIAKLLTEIPEITGVTLRVDGESGISLSNLEFWITVFRGISRAGRRIEIDLHSNDADPLIVDLAMQSGLPIKLSPPYLGHHIGLPYHSASLRKTDYDPSVNSKVHIYIDARPKLPASRYSYGDFLREDRKYGIVWRVWPGTQRVLTWADPVLFAGYSRNASFCGADGIEFCEPYSFKGRMGSGRYGSRTGLVDRSLIPTRDWQKNTLFYRMWGRLGYDPTAPAESWRRATTQSLAAAAADTEAALSAASRVLPLVTLAHGPSASNNSYWPEMYWNLSIVRDTAGRPYYDTPQPERFATVESFDPQLFATVEEAAAALADGRPMARLTPIDVAAMLDGLADEAGNRLDAAKRANVDTPEFRRLATDIAMQTELGRFFANKFRAAVLWSLHLRASDPTAGREAMKAYRTARYHYSEVARLGGIYAADLTYGEEPWLRGHWRDHMVEIDLDIADMARLLGDTNGMATGRKLLSRERLWAAIGQILAAPPREKFACRHNAPTHFTPGQDLALGLGVPDGLRSAKLHYRAVNQAEAWQTMDMAGDGTRRTATIPAAALTPAYPLQYMFEVATDDAAGFFPGLDGGLASVPYYVVRAAPAPA
jgi:hypothetical protein